MAELEDAPWLNTSGEGLEDAPWATPGGGMLDTAVDVAKQIPSGIVAGLEGVAAAPAVLTGLAGKAVDYFFSTDKEKVQEQEKLRRIIEKGQSAEEIAALSPEDKSAEDRVWPFNLTPREGRKGGVEQYLPKPETTAGKYARTVSEFAPAAVASSTASIPGAIARQAVIPGIASEAAGQVAQQLAPESEPYARTAAALATGITGPKKGVFLDAEGLQNAVKESYAHPSVQALQFKGPAVTQLAGSLRSKVEETVPRSQAPGTFAIIDELGSMSKPTQKLTDFMKQTYSRSEGPAVPLAEVETLRRHLNTIRTTYSPQSGTDRLAANIAVRQLDNWMANLSQGKVAVGDAREAGRYLKEARDNAAAGFRAEEVSNRLQSAILRAESTYSGHNVENAVRQNLRTILEPKNKKLRLGWTDEQLAMARKIVSPGWKGNVIREIGNIFGGHLGVWGAGAGVLAGVATGHPQEGLAAAAAWPVGRGLKALGNRMAVKKAEALERSLVNTSPEGRAWAAQQAARPDVGGSPLFLQGATYTQPLQDIGFKSGGPVKPFNPASWREVELPSRVGRLQAGGSFIPGATEDQQPVPDVPVTLPPLDPSLNILSGLSASGSDLNPQGLGPAFVPGQSTLSPQEATTNLGTQLWQPFNNQDVVNQVRADPIGSMRRFNTGSDPRVDAFYAQKQEAGLAADPSDAIAQMQQMWNAIPDAGRGTLLGGIGTLGNRSGSHGADLPSTNNWQLLPPPWRQPGIIVRNGILIDTNSIGFSSGYPSDVQAPRWGDYGPSGPISGVYAPHLGPGEWGPASYGGAGYGFVSGWPGAVGGMGWHSDRGTGNAGYEKRGGLVS